MATNELIPIKKYLPKIRKNTESEEFYRIMYEHIDDAHFSFDCDLDDENSIHMTESDRKTEYTEFLDAEFDESIEEDHKPYLIMATSCGVLTGMLSLFHLDEEKLGKLTEWKESEWKKYVVPAAKLFGYRGNDLKGALKSILDKGVSFVNTKFSEEQQQALKNFVSELSANPTYVGLFFCVCTQFSGLKYSIDETGKIETTAVPSYYAIGKNTSEKLVFALLYWIFFLITDSVISNRNIMDDMVFGKKLIQVIKNLAKEEFAQKIPEDYLDAEQKYSEWISRLFEEREYMDEDQNPVMFKLQDLILENVKGFTSQTFFVLINECLTRASYTVLRIYDQMKRKNLHSFSDLGQISAGDVLPFNNRILSRMLLVSSGVFTGVNLGGATLKALKGKTVDGRDFARSLLMEINLAGLGRFVFACAGDSKYWAEDIKVTFEKVLGAFDRSKQSDADPAKSYYDDSVFEYLVFTPQQARILYSLENLAVSHDIRNTTFSGTVSKKKEWQTEWQAMLMKVMDDTTDSYFITDEEFLYSGLYSLSKDKNNKLGLYLLAVELALFKAYTPLGGENDKEYRKLKYKDSYIDEKYVVKQTIVSQSEVDSIKKEYTRYKGLISGNTQALIAGVGVTAAVAAATGGLALAFAPQIAVLIAGEAVAGLHGAILTSASLAYVGGGAIAFGGLGMAGGTAIITGSGVALGLAGSGAASMIAVLGHSSRDYWVQQISKLLVFCKSVLLKDEDSLDVVKGIADKLKDASVRAKESLDYIVDQKNDLDKPLVKKIRDYVKIMKGADRELSKLIQESSKSQTDNDINSEVRAEES